MSIKKVVALVPIKEYSGRLPKKNFKIFNGNYLFHEILNKLNSIDCVERIIVNTDSDLIKSETEIYNKLSIIDRPESISANDITANTLIKHDLELIEGTHFLQTHVTNPLLSIKTIENAIKTYFESLPKFDSLFSVEEIKKRVYDNKGNALNHSNQVLAQTQDLPSVLVENSNLFLFSRDSFKNNGFSRIGRKPQPYPMNKLEGIDIDYEEDFKLASLLFNHQQDFDLS